MTWLFTHSILTQVQRRASATGVQRPPPIRLHVRQLQAAESAEVQAGGAVRHRQQNPTGASASASSQGLQNFRPGIAHAGSAAQAGEALQQGRVSTGTVARALGEDISATYCRMPDYAVGLYHPL